MKSDLIDIDVKLLHKTENAILITQDDENKVWLPKSQIEFEEDEGGTGRVLVTLPEWLAREKGLI